MSATLVRYRVAPGRAEENAALVRAVYAELAERDAPGFRYATWVLDDGVTFVHLALAEDDVTTPLTSLSAFARFREGLPERCDQPPVVTPLATPVGSHGF